MSVLTEVVNKLWYGGNKDKELANRLTVEFTKISTDNKDKTAKIARLKKENEAMEEEISRIKKEHLIMLEALQAIANGEGASVARKALIEINE